MEVVQILLTISDYCGVPWSMKKRSHCVPIADNLVLQWITNNKITVTIINSEVISKYIWLFIAAFCA